MPDREKDLPAGYQFGDAARRFTVSRDLPSDPYDRGPYTPFYPGAYWRRPSENAADRLKTIQEHDPNAGEK